MWGSQQIASCHSGLSTKIMQTYTYLVAIRKLHYKNLYIRAITELMYAIILLYRIFPLYSLIPQSCFGAFMVLFRLFSVFVSSSA